MTPHIEPAPHSSTEYHLYKLENLFQTLYDFWLAKRQGVRIGQRWLQALTGFTDARQIPETPNAFPITLEVGSRLCNTALKTMTQTRQQHPEAGERHDRVESDIRYMRDLLISLHDLAETGGYQDDFPLEHDTARALLAMLVDKPPELGTDELFEVSFSRGQAIATEAIRLMQETR